MKEQAYILKVFWKFTSLQVNFQGFYLLYRDTYFKEHLWMATYEWTFLGAFPDSAKFRFDS